MTAPKSLWVVPSQHWTLRFGGLNRSLHLGEVLSEALSSPTFGGKHNSDTYVYIHIQKYIHVHIMCVYNIYIYTHRVCFFFEIYIYIHTHRFHPFSTQRSDRNPVRRELWELNWKHSIVAIQMFQMCVAGMRN